MTKLEMDPTDPNHDFNKFRMECAINLLPYLAGRSLNGQLSDQDKPKRKQMCTRALTWVDELWEEVIKE